MAYDAGEKANLDAEGGIADYWVLDSNRRVLQVFRDPIVDSLALRGHRYASHATLQSTDSISPLAAPNATVRVADLLP